MFPPLIRLNPWYPGQFGVPGSGNTKGLRMHPDAITLYVDSGATDASDNNDGTDPESPKATVQSAINSSILTPHSDILVSGEVAEDVVTPDYATGPNYVTLMGQGPSRYAISWPGSDADTISLDVRCLGWRITNFKFMGKTGAAAVELRHTDSGANDIAIRTIIDNCYFDGLTTGLTGLASHGAYDVWVINNTFQLWNNVANTAAGMRVGTTPLAIPYRNHIIGNLFDDSDNGMIWPSNGSRFMGNQTKPVGYAYSMTDVFQTSLVANPGDDNLVVGNYFGGDYSIAGGYRGGAADEWFGNASPDIAEAEVADNGWTILPPT